MFEKYHITQIYQGTLPIFNIKAYCPAKLGNLEDAHKIIDEIIDLADSNEVKGAALDTKGYFYQIEKKNDNSIAFYQKSLSFKNNPPFPFHEETRKKLNNCKEIIKNI